jgi:hypothetical protein
MEMKKWVTGVPGMIVVILTWTLGWGLGFGGLMELYDPAGKIEDIWPMVLGIAGLVGGIVFSVLFRIVEGRRGVDEVSLARHAAWGVVTGLVLGVLAVAAGVGSDAPQAIATMIGVLAALCTVAAIGSAVFFRLLARVQVRTPAERMA